VLDSDMRAGKWIKLILIVLMFLFDFTFLDASSNEPIKVQSDETISGKEAEGKTSEHEKFDPGKFMFDHIKDAYSWHIIDIGHTSVSLPLPVILYSREKGWNFFTSGKFNHGHSEYKGFKIAGEGKYSGRVVEIMPDGSEVLPMLDLSFTKNIASLFISILILLLLFISLANAYKKNENKAPRGLMSWIEPIILFIRDDIARPSIGEKNYEKFMPYLLTLFFFIWVNNILGLIPIFPGGANLTGNVAITMVMALFTFVITNIHGTKTYWTHIVNMPGVPLWLKIPPLPIMPLVETIGLFTKPFVLTVRLFANITAGHCIMLGFVTLIFIFGNMSHTLAYGLVAPLSVAFMVFMNFLELLVGFIQAYVFTFLSALYFSMAMEEHH
jgi:F-type H+-transporting ATPase subunit a